MDIAAAAAAAADDDNHDNNNNNAVDPVTEKRAVYSVRAHWRQSIRIYYVRRQHCVGATEFSDWDQKIVIIIMRMIMITMMMMMMTASENHFSSELSSFIRTQWSEGSTYKYH